MIGGDDPVQAGLLGQRRVMVSGPLDATTVTDATAQLMLLDGLSDDPVNLVVNSPGGAIEDAVGLLDTLRLMRSSVTVDVLGQASGSAGVVVAAAPGRRRVGPSASMSLRLGPTNDASRQFNADELQRLAEATTDLERRIATVVGTRTGQTIDWVLGQFERGSPLFGAEAVDAGLADELR